jgi:hypothetical protein
MGAGVPASLTGHIVDLSVWKCFMALSLQTGRSPAWFN